MEDEMQSSRGKGKGKEKGILWLNNLLALLSLSLDLSL